MIRHRASRCVLLFFVGLLGMAGCSGGGEAKGGEADASEQSHQSVLERVTYGLVVDAFETGQLGTPEEIMNLIDSKHGLEAGSSLIFDGQRHIKPLEELDENQRGAFESWARFGSANEVIGHQFFLIERELQALWKIEGREKRRQPTPIEEVLTRVRHGLLVDAYEQGSLGSRDELQAAMPPIASVLIEQGKNHWPPLLEFENMGQAQQKAFVAWAASDKVETIIDDPLSRIERELRALRASDDQD
jgi:hypothetical protein